MTSNLIPIADSNMAHSGDDSDDDEDDDDVVELSPCGRWEKRRQEVMQRDVPGIDHAFLAMDVEEGVEVVWNEVQFSERKDLKAQELVLPPNCGWTIEYQETIKKVFENLIQLDHANIVKFHKFWTDTQGEKARVIFITEFMTSGSLKQFIKKTRKNNYKTINEKVWKRWCRQILNALSYLHGCEIPIVHGNLSCDTIFIQHNGLIKIGSVAPDTIHNHVKTYREERRNMHFIAPEYGNPDHVVDCAVDVYAFGMCALEMAALELHDIEGPISNDAIQKAIEGLESPQQKEFIRRCLAEEPSERPTVRDLLLDKCLFEVHSLKLLTAHYILDNELALPDSGDPTDPEKVLAVIKSMNGEEIIKKHGKLLELEKFLEEVRSGLYPLTCIERKEKQFSRPRPRPISPEDAESVESEHTDVYDEETRKVISMRCDTKPLESGDGIQLTLLLKLDDRMNRQLSCVVKPGETADLLAEELVKYGFINKLDRNKLFETISTNLVV